MTAVPQPPVSRNRPPQATAAHARARAAFQLERLRHSWLLRITLALAVAWLLTGVPTLLGRTALPAHGLLGFALVIAVFVMLLRLTGFLLVETLWSLRNRLIAAYIFVAVVPVVLIAAMIGIAGYLFYGQYAAYVLNREIQLRQENVDELNALTMLALSRNPNRTAAQEENLSSNYASYYFPSGLPANSYFFNADGSFADVNASRFGPLPAWLPAKGWTGLAADPDGYFLISYHVDPQSGKRVVSFYGIGPRVLDVIADEHGLGVIQMQRWEGESSLPSGDAEPRHDAPLISSFDPLPPRRNIFDATIRGWAFIDSWDWKTGQKVKLWATITTRPTLLNQQLFGDFSATKTGGPATALLLLATVGGVFLIIEFFSLIAGIRMTRAVTSAVDDLYVGTEHVNRGDFSHRIAVRSRDQLAALGMSFNDMTASIGRLLEEQQQKQRLESELAIAHEVQAQLFPRNPPAARGLEIYGRCLPARIVSGDYYDFSDLGGNQVSMALGDISGKGISAALLMATIVAAVRAYQPNLADPAVDGAGAAAVSPARLMERLNRQLFHSTPPEKYATLFYAVYDANQRQLRYTNAGHLPPVVLGRDHATRLESGGMVVGLFEGVSFAEATVQLEAGDLIAAWSDGITEPENEYGVEFGEDRLIEVLRTYRARPLPEIAQLVLTAAHDWSGGEEQADDITLVLARVSDPGAPG